MVITDLLLMMWFPDVNQVAGIIRKATGLSELVLLLSRRFASCSSLAVSRDVSECVYLQLLRWSVTVISIVFVLFVSLRVLSCTTVFVCACVV